jgi:hypothetical protein
MINRQKGQSLLEYAIILGVVALALGSMQIYLRRGIQAGIKIAADELGLQKDAMEVVAGGVDPTEYKDGDIEPMEVLEQEIKVRSEAWAQRDVIHDGNGSQTVVINEYNKIVNVDADTPSTIRYWTNSKDRKEKEE